MYRKKRSNTSVADSNVSFFDLYGEEWMEAPEELLSEEDVTFLETPSPYGERFKEASEGETTVITAPAVPSMPDSRVKKMVFSDGKGRTKMCALIKRKLRSFSTKSEPLKIKSYTDDETIVTVNGVDFNLHVDRAGNVHGISMCKYYGKDEPSADTKGLPLSGLDYLDAVGWCKSADVEVSNGTAKSVAEEIRRMYRISTDW